MKANIHGPRRITRHLALLLIALAPAAFAASEKLPPGSKVLRPTPGGVDPRPTITSVKDDPAGDNLLLKWSGLSGPYQVMQSPAVSGGTWTAVGPAGVETSATVPATAGAGIFRVVGPAPDYVGQSVCRGCHPKTHDGWAETVHKGALDTLKKIGMGNNASCLPCHTVGFGLPGGFVSEATTPRLAGVQCENCHGPAANHISDPGDLTVRPVVSMAGTMCGGCHTDFHHPTFDEWTTSPHMSVNADFTGSTGFLNTNRVAAVARMRACGACHSGAVRLAMLEGTETTPPTALPDMPSGELAANTGITCAVCHTAHEKTANGSQLRNPVASTNFFSYVTATNSNFTAQYSENVQMCGQCHNQRGATWTGTSRPPHHSPQYNMLIGNVGDAAIAGVDLSGSAQSSHREIEKQCTHCHTHQHSPSTPSASNPVYTGHTFEPLVENCTPCHLPEEAEAFIHFRQRTTKNLIIEVKGLLDKWATNKAPDALKAKYGKLAWEFSTPGQLSQPTNGPAVTGPTTAEQAQIPDEIKKGRYLLYIVEHDGSYGVHNARYSSSMLRAAESLINTKLQ